MILSDSKILEEIKKGTITISDFNEKRINPNSYNLTLSNKLKVYTDKVLDPKKPLNVKEIEIPKEGYILQPGVLYIASTNEVISSSPTGTIVPMVEGRSSLGRLGLSVHVTAGFCDIGFNGTITLEMFVIHPVKIYPNMEICQIYYERTEGKCLHPYNGKYQGQRSPETSRIIRDFELCEEDKKLILEKQIKEIVNQKGINTVNLESLFNLLLKYDESIKYVDVNQYIIADIFYILSNNNENKNKPVNELITMTMKHVAIISHYIPNNDLEESSDLDEQIPNLFPFIFPFDSL